MPGSSNLYQTMVQNVTQNNLRMSKVGFVKTKEVEQIDEGLQVTTNKVKQVEIGLTEDTIDGKTKGGACSIL